MDKTYIAIDLKSYYASVECAARGLDPLTTNLVVADLSRTEKTICLAVSPSLKAYGIPSRPRLYEVVQKVKDINHTRLLNLIRQGKAIYQDEKPGFSGSSFDAAAISQDPSLELDYITAPPRMAKYLSTSAQIFGIYGKYVSPEDIHVYSVDEVFIDATRYLKHYNMSARELARTMIREVLFTTGITATAGIGTNLYLAKIAMDIVAKHVTADRDGVRIADLDEQSYRRQLWAHTPMTDFWQTGKGTVRRLEKLGVHTMGDLARLSIKNEDKLYKEFGIDAELLIDHAWGVEPCGIEQIKTYRSLDTSTTEGQVLSEPYAWADARIVVQEMTDSLIMGLTQKKLVTDSLTLTINYDRQSLGGYTGPVDVDFYGRTVPKPAHGSTRLGQPTNLGSQLLEAVTALYDRITDPALLVRRINLTANKLTPDEGILQADLFTDTEKLEKEKRLQQTVLELKDRYGKNAVLKANSYKEKATMRTRNGQIGGHRAGEDEEA